MEIDNGDDDVLDKESVGNDYNLRSEGAPKYNNPTSTSNMVSKKTTPMTSPKKSLEKAKDNGKDSIAVKSTLNMDLNQNI